MKIVKHLFQLVIVLSIISCNDPITEETDGLPNSMSVNMNGVDYDLSNIVGAGADGFGGGAFCRGNLNGSNLYVYMKFNDTVAIGSVFNNGMYDYVYTVTYDSCTTIPNSGLITSEYISTGRIKGTFSASAIRQNDTLQFANGRFDVFLKTAE